MGHPVKERTFSVKLTLEQARAIEQRAKACGVRRTVWLRSIITQAATRQANEGYLRIREPDGATT